VEINPYLFFNGQCEEAFKFYAECLGGNIEMMKYAGSPAEAQVPAEWRDKILHARFTVDGQIVMASDAPPGRSKTPQGFRVSLQVDSPEKAERIFEALSERGNIEMPLERTFWAARFGMCTDRFGTPWMVNCE